MRTGPKGWALIKKWEGLPKALPDGRFPPYICPTGHWTLGYGSLRDMDGNPVTPDSTPVTLEEAEELLTRMLPEYEGYVNKYVTVPLTQNQFDALVSWVYNLGVGNLQASTLLKKLNAGDYDSIPYEIKRWNRGRVNGISTVLEGLKRRREEEAALWALGASESSQATPVPTPPTEKLLEPIKALPGALTDEQKATIKLVIELLSSLIKE